LIYALKTQRDADLRHTPHGSPQTISIYGRNLRPIGAAPIIDILLFLVVVKSEAIEQLCLAFLSDCGYKDTKYFVISRITCYFFHLYLDICLVAIFYKTRRMIC